MERPHHHAMATHAAPSAPRGVTSTCAALEVCKVGLGSKLGIKPSQTPLYYGSYHGFTILIWQLEHICSTVVFSKTFACGAALFKSIPFFGLCCLQRLLLKEVIPKPHLRWSSVPANLNLLTLISQIILSSVTVSFPWESELFPPI